VRLLGTKAASAPARKAADTELQVELGSALEVVRDAAGDIAAGADIVREVQSELAADLDRAVELAERLRSDAARLVPDGFEPQEISLSLGVAAAGGEQAYPLELMSHADEQLYRAKITRNAVGAPRREASPIPLPR